MLGFIETLAQLDTRRIARSLLPEFFLDFAQLLAQNIVMLLAIEFILGLLGDFFLHLKDLYFMNQYGADQLHRLHAAARLEQGLGLAVIIGKKLAQRENQAQDILVRGQKFRD